MILKLLEYIVGRWAYEVGGKRNPTFGLEMREKGVVEVAHSMINPHKQGKQATFNVICHIAEAQHLPEPCQLHFQNWQNWTFHDMSSR